MSTLFVSVTSAFLPLAPHTWILPLVIMSIGFGGRYFINVSQLSNLRMEHMKCTGIWFIFLLISQQKMKVC
jgi:hypothetical protein